MIRPEDVTIIIPHLGADEQQEYAFDQCMDSLEETMPKGMQYVVARNGITACKHIVDFSLLPQGQCKAVNAAVATTNTPWIFITNDDMIYPKDWFDRLTFFPQGTYCISPKLIEPRQGAPTFEVFFAGGAGGDFNKEEWTKFVEGYYARKHEVAIRPGFNFPVLIKRELWDTIGGYDINYDPWGSNGDSDLEYKIKLACVQSYQNTNCIVYHFSQTSGTFNPANDAARFRNYAYFKEKWGFDRTDNGIWEATFEIPDEGRRYRPEWEAKYL